ncbi:hypothetical protein Tco_1465303 [Tanacetum coccineum]
MSLLPLMMLWFRGGGTGSHLGHPHHRDSLIHDTLAPSFGVSLAPIGKRVGPFTACRVAWRHVSHRSSDHHSSSDFTSDSSSSGTSSDSLSVYASVRDTSDQTHSGPSTRVASSRDADLATSSVPFIYFLFRALALIIYADLLPPRKTFRDLYSPEDSKEDHIEISTTDAEAVADLGIGDGFRVDTKDGIGMGVEIAASDIREDKEEFEAEASALEAGQLIASGERASLADKIRRFGRENLRVRALLSIERNRVDSLRHHMALSQEEFCQIRRDCDDAQRRLRRMESCVDRRLGSRPLVWKYLLCRTLD